MGHLHLNHTAIAIGSMAALLALCPSQGFAGDAPGIVDGSRVTMMYHITVPGENFEARDVSQFIQGRHQLLPTLEREVTGMKSGEEKQVRLSPEQGFGPYDEQKKKVIPRSQLPAGAKAGDMVRDQSDNHATVTQLSDSSAVLDYNHPLAGKPLNVMLKILQVDGPSS
ncbi:MAG TPA: FKBP-type peptidyl-prolyl cis-trans isomerase [Nitrospira sp.]|nr:FKBP-type peptidyl-prolyl cis-trans isomerase [Nitrospira sp.]